VEKQVVQEGALGGEDEGHHLLLLAVKQQDQQLGKVARQDRVQRILSRFYEPEEILKEHILVGRLKDRLHGCFIGRGFFGLLIIERFGLFGVLLRLLLDRRLLGLFLSCRLLLSLN